MQNARRKLTIVRSLIGFVVLFSLLAVFSSDLEPALAYTDETNKETLILRKTKWWFGTGYYKMDITTVVRYTPSAAFIISQKLRLYYTTSGIAPVFSAISVDYSGGDYYWKASSPTIYDNGAMQMLDVVLTDSDTFSGVYGRTSTVLSFRVGWSGTWQYSSTYTFSC